MRKAVELVIGMSLWFNDLHCFEALKTGLKSRRNLYLAGVRIARNFPLCSELTSRHLKPNEYAGQLMLQITVTPELGKGSQAVARHERKLVSDRCCQP